MSCQDLCGNKSALSFPLPMPRTEQQWRQCQPPFLQHWRQGWKVLRQRLLSHMVLHRPTFTTNVLSQKLQFVHMLSMLWQPKTSLPRDDKMLCNLWADNIIDCKSRYQGIKDGSRVRTTYMVQFLANIFSKHLIFPNGLGLRMGLALAYRSCLTWPLKWKFGTAESELDTVFRRGDKLWNPFLHTSDRGARCKIGAGCHWMPDESRIPYGYTMGKKGFWTMREEWWMTYDRW